MELVQEQIVLAKDQTIRFNWTANKYGSVILYDVNANGFKSTLQLPCNVSKLYLGIRIPMQTESADDKLSIEFLTLYVQSKRSHKVCFEFNDSLLKKHSDYIPAPKIIVEGAFKGAPFRVAATNLATMKSIEEFEGSNQIVETLNKYCGESTGSAAMIYSIFLKWESPRVKFGMQRCNAVQKLFDSKVLADCVILAADEKKVKCHRCILAANSPVFLTMLTSGLEESQTNVIKMPDVAELIVLDLVAFLYDQNIRSDEKHEDVAFELLRVAHLYSIPALEAVMLKCLHQKEEGQFNMNIAVSLYYFLKNIEEYQSLSKKMVDVMRRRPKEFNSSSPYQELLQKDPQEAAKLALKLLELGSM